MSDFKSKLPDLKELGSMTEKLFHGIKASVSEIIDDYKKKRESSETIKPDDAPKTVEEEKPKEKAKAKAASKKDDE